MCMLIDKRKIYNKLSFKIKQLILNCEVNVAALSQNLVSPLPRLLF